MGLFSKKTEPQTEGKELYTDRRFNTYWLLGISPFKDYTSDEIQSAMDLEIKKLSRVLKTDPVPMVKVKTEEKYEKLQSIYGNKDAILRDRDIAVLMFNEDMMRSNNSMDRELMPSAISRTGWKDGTSLLSIEGMPQCGSCGCINYVTKKCIKCGTKL